MTSEKVKIGIALAVGLTAGIGIGGSVGYVLADRKVRRETEEEIAGVKNLFRRLRDEDAKQARKDWEASPVDQLEEESSDAYSQESLAEEVVRLGYAHPDSSHRTVDPNYLPPTDQDPSGEDDDPQENSEESEYVKRIRVVNPNRNIEDPDDVTQWDRDPHRPYVITEAEFRIDREDLEKISITYYKGDDTLADEQDGYIPDPDGTVGLENLQFFGYGTNDERLLHIRNERVGADFEVTLNDGSFALEVLGFGIDTDMVKESKNRIKKMRPSE